MIPQKKTIFATNIAGCWSPVFQRWWPSYNWNVMSIVSLCLPAGVHNVPIGAIKQYSDHNDLCLESWHWAKVFVLDYCKFSICVSFQSAEYGRREGKGELCDGKKDRWVVYFCLSHFGRKDNKGYNFLDYIYKKSKLAKNYQSAIVRLYRHKSPPTLEIRLPWKSQLLVSRFNIIMIIVINLFNGVWFEYHWQSWQWPRGCWTWAPTVPPRRWRCGQIIHVVRKKHIDFTNHTCGETTNKHWCY